MATWSHRGTSDKLVLCFSGIGNNPNACPRYEFAAKATGNGQHNALFIADPNRTWLNAPNLLEHIASEIAAFKASCDVTRVIAMGHSMGGFCALVAPAITHVDSVLAFAPQISIHPKVVPNETRWMGYREKITRFRIISAGDHFNKDTAYTVIHGRHSCEAPQRDIFPKMANLRHYIMPKTQHNVPQRLKSMNCLGEVIQYSIDGRPRKQRLLLKNKAGAVLLPHQGDPLKVEKSVSS